jgi:hypothetical protein
MECGILWSQTYVQTIVLQKDSLFSFAQKSCLNCHFEGSFRLAKMPATEAVLALTHWLTIIDPAYLCATQGEKLKTTKLVLNNLGQQLLKS